MTLELTDAGTAMAETLEAENCALRRSICRGPARCLPGSSGLSLISQLRRHGPTRSHTTLPIVWPDDCSPWRSRTSACLSGHSQRRAGSSRWWHVLQHQPTRRRDTDRRTASVRPRSHFPRKPDTSNA